MTTYTPSNPQWSDSIDVTDTSTPNNGDLIASPDKKVMDNTVVLKKTKAAADSIAPVENTTTASRAYTVGKLLYLDNVLYKVIADIAQGATLIVDTNIEETTLEEVVNSLENGGSTVTVTTEEATLIGEDCTLAIDGATYTAEFSADGEAVFSGITETGIATISATDGNDTGTETLTMLYYGAYTVEISLGTYYTLNITTPESTLIGKNITITNGVDSATAKFSASGTAKKNIKFTGSVTISSTDGVNTASITITVSSGTQSYSVDLRFVQIYGVEWDGTNTTALSRTDDAAEFTNPVPYYSGMSGTPSSPFDSIAPWSEMTVSDRTGGKMVKIEKFYFKWTKTGIKMKLQIIPGIYSAYALANEYQISPAHRDRGDGVGERDVVYVGRYHCASSDYKSRGGEKPKASITRATARQAIANLGADIWQYDIAMLETIWMLYLVEFADWNSQAKIGYGCGNNSSTENMGYTDSMPYHTGTMLTSKTTYGVGTQYRNIEGIWDNVVDWCDGIYFNGADIYGILKPSQYSDTTGGTKIGTRPTTAGWTSAFAFSSATGFEWFMYPSAVGGTDGSDYISDYCDYHASGVVLCVGGNYYQYQNHGVFCLAGDSAASVQSASVGSRLQELPSAA